MALEELHDLKEVWSELSKIWEQIDQMKEQPWVSVQPRKVTDGQLSCRSHLNFKLFVKFYITIFVSVFCSFVRVWMLF